MRLLRALGKLFWRFMVIFSFIVNIILVVVLIALLLFIFEIKNQVAQPLVEGLHSSFVGLDQATIDWTIPVRDEIQVVLDIPLQTDTVVRLTQPVPLQVNALIDLPGINAYNVNAAVNLELPVGLELPVALDLVVNVDQPLPVELDVRAVIPIQGTQLHDVAQNLRLQLEPLAIALNNLPSDFGEAGNLVGDVLSGEHINLLAPNEYSIKPWPGYSLTAGYGYDLLNEPIPPQNVPLRTGLVQIGGMPFLDEQIRPDIYDAGGPLEINQQAINNLNAQGIPPQFYSGEIGGIIQLIPRTNIAPVIDGGQSDQSQNTSPGVEPTPPSSYDEGIITPEDEDEG